jgi:hypothetical protein
MPMISAKDSKWIKPSFSVSLMISLTSILILSKNLYVFSPTLVSSQAHFQADVFLPGLHGPVGTESSPEAYCRHPTASLWYAPGGNRQVLLPWQNNSTTKPSYLLLRNSGNLWSNVSLSSKQRRFEKNTCGEHQTRLPGMHW